MPDSILYCIANPHSARGRKRGRTEEVQEFFREQGQEVRLLWTESPRHGIELARDLADSGAVRIVSLGGDGTSFEVINGVLSSKHPENVRVGLIPLGTGNAFLADFGVTNWQEAARRIVEGKTVSIDIGKTRIFSGSSEITVFFHNMIGLGLIAHACRLRSTTYAWMGEFGYHGAFFHGLTQLRPYSMQLRVQGGDWQPLHAPLLGICNSQYTGRGMRLSPESQVNDGVFELLYMNNSSIFELIKLFVQLPSGKHLQHPNVHWSAVRSLEIHVEGIDFFMVDGEILDGNHLQIEVLPRVLEIFV